LSPRLPYVAQPDPPDELRPYEEITVPRPGGRESLAGTWYPATAETARGAVLLLPPWLAWGRSYFHRRGRIEALRAAGYHALTLDLPGPRHRTTGFFDRDVEAGLNELQRRASSLPLHVWGVSAGGYWAHPVLSRTDGIAGAFFEDVAPHLIEWSWRLAPLGRPFYLFFRHVLRSSYRYLDMRRHAEAFTLRAVTYVGGAKDKGVLPADTRDLATHARGRCHIVDRARHLDAIKLANQEVLALALETFARAEEGLRTSQTRSRPVFESHPKALEMPGVASHENCVPLSGESRKQ
jgi:pimeloyl-ACP methyl ester carboxylesterase